MDKIQEAYRALHETCGPSGNPLEAAHTLLDLAWAHTKREACMLVLAAWDAYIDSDRCADDCSCTTDSDDDLSMIEAFREAITHHIGAMTSLETHIYEWLVGEFEQGLDGLNCRDEAVALAEAVRRAKYYARKIEQAEGLID